MNTQQIMRYLRTVKTLHGMTKKKSMAKKIPKIITDLIETLHQNDQSHAVRFALDVQTIAFS